MTDAPIAVLGTGMAAHGASRVLHEAGAKFLRFDKNPHIGGHTRSIRYDSGFVFDDGVHISFTKNEHVRRIFADNLGGRYEEKEFAVDNYWRGHRIPHPVQCNLSKLPPDVIIKVIGDFVAQRQAALVAGMADRIDRSTDVEIAGSRTYAEWLYAVYGKAFAETFPIAYGEKYHTLPMTQLNTEWVGQRMYRPSLDDMLRGALDQPIPGAHYIQNFRYPQHGGFVSFIEAAGRKFDTRLNHQVVGLDPDARLLRFANGEVHSYSSVISTVPLPELISVIDRVPVAVVEANKKLAFSSVVLVNVGVNRSTLSEAATTYFYDTDIIISRISLPHLLSPNNAPPGCGSIQAEVYFSDKYKPLDVAPDALVEPVLRDLRRCGFITDDDEILMTAAEMCRYANVIYDFERAAALSIVHDYLDTKRIHFCGRYGDWNHAWTDEAFVSGENAAKKLLESTPEARNQRPRSVDGARVV